MAVTTAQVQELYVAYLGRAADQEGLNYWMAELNAEPAVLTLENLRANFVNEQQEYADIYGDLSREESVIQIYNNLFGRAPDSEGLAYWTTGEGAAVNSDQLLVAFINGAAPTDAQVVANKVLVSNIYTQLAGSNFSLADAAAAIAGVDATSGSVSTAIGGLTDLPSVAVPEAVAQVQAAAEAAKQVADFEKSQTNIDKLVALNEKVDALNEEADLGVELAPLDGDDEGTAISFQEARTAQVNAQNVRDAVMLEDATDTQSTAIFTTIASEAASDLASARTALVNGVTGALAAVRDFESAAAKADASEAVDLDAVNLRTAQLQVVAEAQKTQWTAAVAKLSTANLNAIDAGETPDGAVTADELYDFLSAENTTSTQVTAVTSAFSSFEGFSAVAELAAQAQANAKAGAALIEAQGKVQALVDGSEATALDNAYLSKFAANADAQETLADAKAADALLNDIKAVVASYTSLTDAADKAAATLAGAESAVAVAADAGDDDVAEVFFFGTKADGTATVEPVAGDDDVALTVSEGDSIYIGSGWTLNSAATFDADTGVITGGSNGAKEIFFVQTDTAVQAVIETTDFGSASAIGGNANVAVITLTGVESLDDVSFANGMINVA